MQRLVAVLIAIYAMSAASVAEAGSAGEFDAAYAAAAQAEQQAAALRNQWLPTESALRAARQAAEQKNFDAAIALARVAQALAVASIEQARSEAKRWQDAVIK